MNGKSQPPFDLEQRLREYYRWRSLQTQQHILPQIWERIESQLSAAEQGSEMLDSRSPDLLFSSEDHIPMLPEQPDSPQKGISRRPAFSIAAVLLTIAIIVAFVWFGAIRNHQAATHSNAATSPPSATAAQTCSIPTPPSAAGKPIQPYHAPHGTATYAGVTITFDHAYADAVQTIVYVRVHSTTNNQPTLSQMVVSDEEGNVYQYYSGSQYTSKGVSIATIITNPLPAAMLGSPHTFTLTVFQMSIFVGGKFGTLNGIWQMPFTVTPATPKVYNLHVAPQVKCGVTVQPVRLDVATDTFPYMSNPDPGYVGKGDLFIGGDRLVLKISGLPPVTSLSFLTTFATSYLTPLGGGGADNSDHLTLADIEPAQVVVQNLDPARIDQSVDPSGTVLVEVIFYKPLARTSGTVPLHIDELDVDYARNSQVGGILKRLGPWDFQIPLG